jgi:hypothetical protein
MKGMWKIVLPSAVMLMALSACDQSKEETTVVPAEPAAEAPMEPTPEAAPMEPAMEAPVEAPVDGTMPPADGAAPAEEMKEGAPAE